MNSHPSGFVKAHPTQQLAGELELIFLGKLCICTFAFIPAAGETPSIPGMLL